MGEAYKEAQMEQVVPPVGLEPTTCGLKVRPLHLDEYELWQASRRLSPLTMGERRRVLERFHKDTGVQPAQASAVEVMRWIADHPHWSQSTACTYYAYLNAWFKWLQAQGLRDDNPMVRIGSPKSPDRLPRPVSDADMRSLLTAPTHQGTHGMVLLAGFQGLRVSEIARVKGEDLNLDRMTLLVRGKGGSVHDLPLHPRVAQYSYGMPRKGWWFPAASTRPGEHVRGKSVSRVISDLMERQGVAGTPHSLRHWFATSLLAGGADLLTVKDLLRHKSTQTTAIYTKVPTAFRADAIKTIDPWG